MALGSVREDRDSGENVAQAHLAAGEDRSAGHAELSVAALALEDAAGLERIDRRAAALAAIGLAAVVIPTDRLEGLERLIFRQAHDLGQRERPGSG